MNDVNFRQASQAEYKGPATTENLNAGSLQRIADSLEKMEQPYLKLLADVKFLSGARTRLLGELESERNTNRTLRGHITRLRNKLEEGGPL